MSGYMRYAHVCGYGPDIYFGMYVVVTVMLCSCFTVPAALNNILSPAGHGVWRQVYVDYS